MLRAHETDDSEQNKETPMTEEETPVLDVLAAMTAVSIESSSLDNRELMLGRIAALASVDAPAMSYLMNVGAAVDSGITIEDVQGLLIGIAPIIGTARTASAAANITEALGFAILAIAEEIEAELEAEEAAEA
jgi:alkylhydroperoxidase/carboxymuconolactone decarboxylase family protein YurZ